MTANLFSKLQEAKKLIEDAKSNLYQITIGVESDGGEIKIEANANKMITKIEISESFYTAASKVEFEKILLSTTNKALDEAARAGEIEMKKITSEVLPNFPGLV